MEARVPCTSARKRPFMNCVECVALWGDGCDRVGAEQGKGWGDGKLMRAADGVSPAQPASLDRYITATTTTPTTHTHQHTRTSSLPTHLALLAATLLGAQQELVQRRHRHPCDKWWSPTDAATDQSRAGHRHRHRCRRALDDPPLPRGWWLVASAISRQAGLALASATMFFAACRLACPSDGGYAIAEGGLIEWCWGVVRPSPNRSDCHAPWLSSIDGCGWMGQNYRSRQASKHNNRCGALRRSRLGIVRVCSLVG